MFDSRVLGVDPGIARMGLAVVSRQDRKVSLDWAATIRSGQGAEDTQRLLEIASAVRAAITRHDPSAVALERVAWNKNQVSALQVARATGVVMLVAAECGLPVHEFSPTEVKAAVTGQGNAGKDQVRTALERVHGLVGLPDEPDAADATAVAITYLTAATMRRLAARAGIR